MTHLGFYDAVRVHIALKLDVPINVVARIWTDRTLEAMVTETRAVEALGDFVVDDIRFRRGWPPDEAPGL